jgi:hypothetical protein
VASVIAVPIRIIGALVAGATGRRNRIQGPSPTAGLAN